jgi:DeoR/GlpR family transcriptional regulator of sugar metabolism
VKKRIDEIRELLLQDNKVLVSELSDKYQVSEVSIRKDLTLLEKQGFAKKVYGGAVLIPRTVSQPSPKEDFYQDRILSALAKRACLEINDGDNIFLGSGRTCCIMARQLHAFKNLTVVTNNITALPDLLGQVARVYLIGGEVTSTDGQTLFSSWGKPQNFSIDIFVNKAFTSIAGIDLKAGLTVDSIISTHIYKHLPGRAHQWYLIADASKFDRIAIYSIAGLDTITAIISNAMPDRYRDYFRQHEIRMIDVPIEVPTEVPKSDVRMELQK